MRSEADAIVAKYSAIKPDLSRVSPGSPMRRAHVTLNASGLPSASATPAQTSSSTPFRIVSRGSAGATSQSLAPQTFLAKISNSSLTPSHSNTVTGRAAPTPVTPNRTISGASNSPSLRRVIHRGTAPLPSNAPVGASPVVRSVDVSNSDDDPLVQLQNSYSSAVQFFSELAADELNERKKLGDQVRQMEGHIENVTSAKRVAEIEKEQKVSQTQEQCSRQILNMRKTLLLSEQAAGSLRTENDHLYMRATEVELLREEVESLKALTDDLEKRMTILAQQNSALQRALKQKEIDTQSDLDLYVKQLDLVQSQNDAMKKEMEIMSINARQQQAIENENERLRSRTVELTQLIKNLDGEAAEMQEKISLASREKDEECAREVLNYRRQVVSLEKHVESLQNQLQAVQRRYRPSALNDDVEELNEKVGQMSSVLVEQEQQKEALQRLVAQQEEELKHERKKNADLTKTIDDERLSQAQLREEYQRVTSSLSRAVADARQTQQVPRQ